MKFLEQIFNQPVSKEVADGSADLKSLIGINIVIYVIFIFLEPFNFKVIGYNKYLISLVFVFSYFISILVTINYFLPKIKALLKLRHYYLYHYFIGYLMLIIIVAVTHQLVQNILNGYVWSNFGLFYQTVINAFFIGLIPTTILSLVKYSLLLEKQLKTPSSHLTKALKQYPLSGILALEVSKKNAIIRFEKANILYIKSEDNYINIHNLDESNQIHTELIRMSLKNIHDKLDFPFLKVHRSYIVNLNQIKKVTGNSQGMQIILNGIKEPIPVSRSYTDTLKKAILNK